MTNSLVELSSSSSKGVSFCVNETKRRDGEIGKGKGKGGGGRGGGGGGGKEGGGKEKEKEKRGRG